MITSVDFKNFRILRDTKLSLGPLTVLVGPNGSGKTTVLQAIETTALEGGATYDRIVTASRKPMMADVSVTIRGQFGGVEIAREWVGKPGGASRTRYSQGPMAAPPHAEGKMKEALAALRVFDLKPDRIPQPNTLKEKAELSRDGANLSVVLDSFRDQHPEQWERLIQQLPRWFPEFDQILFDVPKVGARGFGLRLAREKAMIQAADLSHGTLLGVALLTLACLPRPPRVLGLEEPDRGIHPRLLREVRDALYRLAYPKDFGEDREPVQVIATTHSPYMLDQFRDHPEEVVIAEKLEDNVRFTRLSDMPHIGEILGDASLGEAWCTGVLGGVPAGT